MKMTIEGVNPPVRKTKGSCGYDIHCPENIDINAGQWASIDTGILLDPGDIPEGYVGLIVPRSSMGMKYKLRLANTVGVIDSDYTMATIKATITVETDIQLMKNERILQMILVPFGVIPTEEPPTEERKGGCGSTGL